MTPGTRISSERGGWTIGRRNLFNCCATGTVRCCFCWFLRLGRCMRVCGREGVGGCRDVDLGICLLNYVRTYMVWSIYFTSLHSIDGVAILYRSGTYLLPSNNQCWSSNGLISCNYIKLLCSNLPGSIRFGEPISAGVFCTSVAYSQPVG